MKLWLFTILFFATNAFAWPSDSYLRVINHLHTQNDSEYIQTPDPKHPENSYSAAGIRFLVNLARQQDVDVLMITEHNTFAHCFDPVFQQSYPDVTLICGSEWTSSKGFHLNIYFEKLPPPGFQLVPKNPKKAATEAEVAQVVKQVHAMGGVVSLNHPGMPFYQPSNSLGVDFVEALVPLYSRPSAVLDWWTKEINRSKKPLPGMSCSDYHVGGKERERFDAPVALVPAERNLKSVLGGILAGKAIMLDSWEQPMRLFATLATRNGGVYPGETFRAISSKELTRLDVETSKAVGATLLVTMNGHILYDRKITYDGQKVSLQVLPPTSFNFIRAELRGAMGIPAVVLNPIYISTGTEE